MSTYSWTVTDTSDGVNFHDARVADGEETNAYTALGAAMSALKDATDAAGRSVSHYSDETDASGIGEIRYSLDDDSELTITIKVDED